MPSRRLTIVRAADVRAECVRWFWEPWIAFGRLSLIEGDPGWGRARW
jgi:hypothetical protein